MNAPSNGIAIELRNVNLTIGGVSILSDINLKILAAAASGVVGLSGAGKSTILKLVLGLMKPDSGEIFVEGEEITAYTEAQMMLVRRKLGMVFQESALFDSLTVRENVGYILYERHEMSDPEIEDRIVELLTLVELEEMIDKMPAELSGGQKRRVAIARAMASAPGIILFDEPTAGLDPVTSNVIIKQIMKLRDFRHVTSVLVTHKLEDVFKMAHNIVVRDQDGIRMVKDPTGEKLAETRFFMISEGRLIFEGTAEDFRNSPDPRVQEFLL
jgi:phospholipid/cholesterol/gamma-HCH transport system ATP-binding protein